MADLPRDRPHSVPETAAPAPVPNGLSGPAGEIAGRDIVQYLRRHPDFLERHPDSPEAESVRDLLSKMGEPGDARPIALQGRH